MKTVLVTGGAGQLGTELRRTRWPKGWAVEAIDIAELDLTDADAIRTKVASQPYAAVINAAAYTAVDKAESDVAAAWAVNALAPAAFAQGCGQADIPLIQVSTDYVFDGRKTSAWEVDDTPAPLSVYGASKLGGELAARTGCPRHAIVRTSWVVSAHGHNFIKTMLRLGAERDRLSVVDDQYGAPTGAADLAQALATIAVRLVEDDQAPSGIWHFSNAGRTSWCGLARAVFAKAQAYGGPSPEVAGIPTSAYPTPAHRPVNSLMSHAATTRDFGIVPRPWDAALDDIIRELIGPAAKENGA